MLPEFLQLQPAAVPIKALQEERQMSELAATAERLRVVKDACVDFITLWAIDQLVADDRVCASVHGDVLNASEGFENNKFSMMHSERRLTD
jgi:hypothetical protein